MAAFENIDHVCSEVSVQKAVYDRINSIVNEVGL